MSDLQDEEPLQDLVESVDFADDSIYLQDGVSKARWERANKDLPIQDLIRDLYGLTGSPISCPFHGRDSKPSFYIYPRANDCYCFGCGEEDGYWNATKIVARHFGWRKEYNGEWRDDRLQALHWIEKNYDLPDLPNDVTLRPPDVVFVVDEPQALDLSDEDEGPSVPILLVREPYVLEASRQVRRAAEEEKLDLAKDLIERLFTAIKQDNSSSLLRVVPKAAREPIYKAAKRLQP